MNLLDSARQKPLPERKRLVWILSLVSVAIIIVTWLTFFNEWKLPDMDISQSGDLQALVNTTKESASSIQEQINSIQETTDEVTQLAQEQLKSETQATTFTKKNVEVTFSRWRKENSQGFVTVNLHNLAETPVTFKNFVLRQGYEEITAPVEETLDPQQEKDLEINFALLNSTPVTAFEIREVSFGTEESWDYLFVIRDQGEDTAETSTTPVPTETPTPTPGETPVE